MRYFFTYRYYYDCPTCDGYSDEVYLSELYDSQLELIKDLKHSINNWKFLDIHSVDEDGLIVNIAPIDYSTGFHSVRRVWVKVGQYTYTWAAPERSRDYELTSDDPNFNLIYGK